MAHAARCLLLAVFRLLQLTTFCCVQQGLADGSLMATFIAITDGGTVLLFPLQEPRCRVLINPPPPRRICRAVIRQVATQVEARECHQAADLGIWNHELPLLLPP